MNGAPFEPLGDPIYVVESPSGYAYAPPVAPPSAPARRSDPAVGWSLLAAGAVTLISAAFLPWLSISAPSDTLYVAIPDDRGGAFAVGLASVIVIASALIAVGFGRLWTSLVTLAASTLLTVDALLQLALQRAYGDFSFGGEPVVSLAYGLWLCLAASLVSMGLSIMGLTRRKAV